MEGGREEVRGGIQGGGSLGQAPEQECRHLRRYWKLDSLRALRTGPEFCTS